MTDVVSTIKEEMDSVIARMLAIRAEMEPYQNTLEVLEEEYNKLGELLLNDMDLLGMKSAKTSRATLSVSETTRPGVADWQEFCRYITETQSFELLERRPAVKASIELNQLGVEIPGIYFFTKRKINVKPT